MIVLSLILVIIAALTLLFGFFSDGLELIWISIGACVLSIITLAVGVMQRRRAQPEPTQPGVGYGPGAVGPKPAPAQLMDLERVTAPPEVVAKTSARDIAERRGDLERADVEAAAAEAVDEVVVVPASSARKATRKKAAKKKSTRKKAATKKAPAKKAATKKSTRKKAATKKAATKKATRKKAATKKAAKSTGATTGAAARDVLRSIKGVGPAKQDALLKQYKSIEAIKAASVDEIASLDGLGPTAAKKIKNSLK